MAINIERLLRLTADYHNFCSDDYAKQNAGFDPDELGEDEMEFIAAAGTSPLHSFDADDEADIF